MLACQLLVGHVKNPGTTVTSRYRVHEKVVSDLSNSGVVFYSANTFAFFYLIVLSFLYTIYGLWDVRPCSLVKIHLQTCEMREKINKMQQLDVYHQHFLNMFRASLYPSSGEQGVCYCTWCAALVLLDVVGSGCGALRCRVRAL